MSVDLTIVEHYRRLRPVRFSVVPELRTEVYAAGRFEGVPFGLWWDQGTWTREWRFECALRLGESGMRKIRAAVKEAEPQAAVEIPGGVNESSDALYHLLRGKCARIYPGKEAHLAAAAGATFYAQEQEWRVPRHLDARDFGRWAERPVLPADAPRFEEVKELGARGRAVAADPAEVFERHVGAHVFVGGEWREALFNSVGKSFEREGARLAYHYFELL